jgi:superfamily II DNA or RNA helicase/HKD family nuclease
VTFDFGELERDVSFGYLDRDVSAPRRYNPRLVLNTASDSMLRTLRSELRRCTSFTFSVAFVSPRAIALLKQELIDFEGVGRIITSDYLGFNSPSAFHELLNLQNLSIDVRLHNESAFHPKGYIFQRPEGVTAILGSSNLTETALATNHEWNLMVSASRDSDLADQFTNLLDEQQAQSVPLTAEWIERYALSYRPPARTLHQPRILRLPEGPLPGIDEAIQPNSMQQEALVAIGEMRSHGARRSLVISATGTGKTILSALDVRQVDPERLLFIAHREQILDRAMREFGRVLGAPASDFGKLAGSSRDTDRKYVFATVQTLSQPGVLEQFDPAAFDYILIDEVHRAGAASYTKVVEYFTPHFLLGMTATPERSDGVSIFELFNYNVPYEIRLNRALELDMLAPFHYYGVTDVTFEDGLTTSDSTPLSRLVSTIRVDHVLAALETYGQAGVAPTGLIFCSRTDEAHMLSDALNGRSLRGSRLRTVALTGDDSIERREAIVEQLEEGLLDYILTVDIFNEGVDIPSVNQVVMLRQTQSSIVFVQQLGRGLRKSDGKEYLVVIDFIGNYANNYLIPVALFGDDSLNKESLRKNLIAAEEAGVLPGMSSVRFDRVAQDRVLKSLTAAKLDSLHNLKSSIETIRNRLGHIPRLFDFFRFESADPIVLATKLGSYPDLVEKVLGVEPGLTSAQLDSLKVISHELLTSKRPLELLLLKLLLNVPAASRFEIAEAFAAAGLAASDVEIASAIRSLTLEFNTEPERQRYPGGPPAQTGSDGFTKISTKMARWYRESDGYRECVDDLMATGLAIVAARFDSSEPFTAGRQYSRKDASRLLNWSTNRTGTIFGYAIDRSTLTCPIFVTLHKDDDVSASTAYEDELLDPSTMLWYTRSRRTLASAEVKEIVDNTVELHVFAKKDDAEGTDFYYLGRAHARDAEETTMLGNPDGLPVVRMQLGFERPIDEALFDYFRPIVTVEPAL